jgi:hypothetical protein
MSKKLRRQDLKRQAVQARIADIAILLHAWACTLSEADIATSSAHGGQRRERP